MWEESTCLRFRENMQARDAIRYVLERGDSCFTEYIGRNGGFQDIIIGSECAEVCSLHCHKKFQSKKFIVNFLILFERILNRITCSFLPGLLFLS